MFLSLGMLPGDMLRVMGAITMRLSNASLPSSAGLKSGLLSVIQCWIEENSPNNITELLAAFPQETRSGGLFVPFNAAEEIYNRQGIYRHFLGKNELIEFPDATKYAICYGEMTKVHKARGFHQSNRSASIAVKETVCKAYAEGEDLNYEGKGQ